MRFKSRREKAKEEHDFTTKEEQSSIDESIESEKIRSEEKERKRKILETEFSYKIVRLFAKLMDEWCIDPILGLVFPGVGDTISLFMSIPYLYVSIFKIKSYALTVVILKNILFDYLISIIPVAGDILDFFVRSYIANYKLIVGYVEDDKETIRKVKKSAAYATITVLILIALSIKIYVTIIKLIMQFFS